MKRLAAIILNTPKNRLNEFVQPSHLKLNSKKAFVW
jgi:hypothetical protein